MHKESAVLVINDNADLVYFESQALRVYDGYCVMTCHHCQGYGHIAEKCTEKGVTCGKCADNRKT